MRKIDVELCECVPQTRRWSGWSNVSKINDIRLKKDILLFFEDMKEEVFSECKIDRKILF